MAVLRNPLIRLSLGATLVLSPLTVLAQAPAVPTPGAAPVPAPVVVPPGDATPPPASAQAPTAAQASGAPATKPPSEEPQWEDPLAGTAAATEEPESMGWMLLRTVLVLGAVVASIYLTLNVGLRRLMGLQGASSGRQMVVSVVERLPLDPKRQLFVVKAADEYLLVGGGESGLQLLSKLDTEAVERIRAQRPQTNVVPLSPFLQKLLSRRSGGSSSQPPGA
ncbi:FliO/MopB family protein [Myxococcus landrumensis]|uniref:FliO/MopB family protein n=1 Tax=Myxococcus landrumensis TaxID=2813577 RepID=A0ABX7NGN6_9BACT|nr:flagellar biosynthetic protein FliO [Myxococcus landrumus]QSQ16765.1 FliO/MopB family protein [Myxococcus landrumus]